jgi:NAD(P)-dependent dehydrogenase (short-subunit alcohol dehydrogenase family)
MNQTDNPRVAIITGASQGIGAGLVSALRSAGYAVVGTSLSIRPSEAHDFNTAQGDIAQVETAQRVVEQALDRFGRDRWPDQQRRHLHRKTIYRLHSERLCRDHRGEPRRVLPHHPACGLADGHAGGGHVVNITTRLVDHADSKRPSALASLTKGGLAAVMRSLAIEYASRGVRVNAVALGAIRTPIHDRAS